MIQKVTYDRKEVNTASCDILSLKEARKVRQFHESFPVYQETPLVELSNLAELLGVKNIYVKDEAKRFGLNAFKVLGGSYAIGNIIAEKLGEDITKLDYHRMVSPEIRKQLGDITFISATDGNHGRGVAWTANQLKQKSVILMPKGSSEERLNHILSEGADAVITQFNYDDAVRKADTLAKENQWILVQDTSWEGYENIPTWIMQGYMTMAYEAYEQLKNVKPTHIFVQAGVGSFAGAVIGFFTGIYGVERPIMSVVEPDQAACIYATAKVADGKRHFVTGDMPTIMAGLACGEPNIISWEILKKYTDHFITCPDYMAAQGMRILGNPLRGDERIIAGESGACSFGMVTELLRNPEYANIKNELGLDENSVILFFNSEGDTDMDSYHRIVWDGAFTREK